MTTLCLPCASSTLRRLAVWNALPLPPGMLPAHRVVAAPVGEGSGGREGVGATAMSSLFLEAVDIPSDRSAADRAVLAPHRMERQPDGESLAHAGARE